MLSPWLTPGTFIDFVEDPSIPNEPMYFVVPAYISVPPAEKLKAMLQADPELKKMFVQPLGLKKITGLKLTVSSGGLSETARTLSRKKIVTIKKGKTPAAELVFDGGLRGKTLDARPTLPLVLRY